MAADKNKKGLFITFEGPDGSGKTTVIHQVCRSLLRKYPNKIVTTREPGGKNNAIAEDIRNIILNKLEYKITPMTEALLFAASRAQHVNDFIKPNLQANNIILCDRFVHSSLIYQGIARGLGFEVVKKINDHATQGVKPDLTFVLMVKPLVAQKRIRDNTNREFNRLDREALEMHNKVYKGYQDMIKKYKKEFKVIDASKPIDTVVRNVLKIINAKIAKDYEA